MQPPRPSSRGTIVFTLVAVVALGSTVAATGLGSGAQRRLDASRAKLRAECTGTSGASPCARRSPLVLTKATLQVDELAAADRALKVGDRGVAAAHLATVLENATAMDRRNTIIASLIASSLVEQVATRIDADPALLDQGGLVATLRRVSLPSAKHPLASERLEALSRLSRVPSEMPIQSAGFAERKTAEAMSDVDVALRKMETASIAKDTAACEGAAASTRGLAATVTVGPGMCAFASRIVASSDRLADLRSRANARARTHAMTTTRL